jgi:hypothetical protein
MTPQEIIEGDKILAVFMEGYYNEKHDCITWSTVEKSPNKYETWISVENLKYHSSWDWLMPVVKKCRFKTSFSKANVDKFSELDKAITSCLCNCEISNLFEAVIDFVKWYNQNNEL